MTPLQHAAVGWGLAGMATRCGWRVNIAGVLLGSVLPDIDFVLFVPFLGRRQGHRTITHAPACHIVLALMLRRFGFWSVLAGLLAHSAADNITRVDRASGVAWLWPLVWKRIPLTYNQRIN